MSAEKAKETWGAGPHYERYMGRWSRLVAKEFLAWLAVDKGKTWIDVGCGTGGLLQAILDGYAPSRVFAVDRSEGFLSEARRAIGDPRVCFESRDATQLPVETASCDASVSGLVLNFVPDHRAMVCEMMRVTRPGGRVAVYVWDYAGGMEMVSSFWDAAITVRPDDAALNQADRFPLCRPEPLRALFEEVALTAVLVRPITISTVFANFDDYWDPFLGGQGSAPTYLASVDSETRNQIRQALRARLAPEGDGAIVLDARAWAVQGVVPD